MTSKFSVRRITRRSEPIKPRLKDRLGLEISPEKSKVVNLKRQYSEFLGFKLKVRKKGKNTSFDLT